MIRQSMRKLKELPHSLYGPAGSWTPRDTYTRKVIYPRSLGREHALLRNPSEPSRWHHDTSALLLGSQVRGIRHVYSELYRFITFTSAGIVVTHVTRYQ